MVQMLYTTVVTGGGCVASQGGIVFAPQSVAAAQNGTDRALRAVACWAAANGYECLLINMPYQFFPYGGRVLHAAIPTPVPKPLRLTPGGTDFSGPDPNGQPYADGWWRVVGDYAPSDLPPDNTDCTPAGAPRGISDLATDFVHGTSASIQMSLWANLDRSVQPPKQYPQATGYIIQRRQNCNSPWVTVGTPQEPLPGQPPTHDAANRSWVDTGLSPNTTYWWRCFSTTATGTLASPPSGIISRTTPGASPNPPGQPTAVSGKFTP